ncbi:hypothetical protein [Selenomonas sp. AB3002]|uniref:hypothetical protein n=1 Tax=Selenomonas sp. AB3002 TaxID=1392502 RepID=UPI0004979A82
MSKRLTWEEIKKIYPGKWVGLSNVEWKDEANVSSAIVEYAGESDEEPLKRQLAGEDMYTIYTTPDDLCPLGMLVSGK